MKSSRLPAERSAVIVFLAPGAGSRKERAAYLILEDELLLDIKGILTPEESERLYRERLTSNEAATRPSQRAHQERR